MYIVSYISYACKIECNVNIHLYKTFTKQFQETFFSRLHCICSFSTHAHYIYLPFRLWLFVDSFHAVAYFAGTKYVRKANFYKNIISLFTLVNPYSLWYIGWLVYELL